MKILLIVTLLIADFAFASGASFAGDHGHGYFRDHDRREKASYRHHDHDGLRHWTLFGWKLPLGWDFDDDDDDDCSTGRPIFHANSVCAGDREQIHQ